MYTHRVEVLDRADNNAIVSLITHHLHFEFFPAQQRFLDQNLRDRREFEAALKENPNRYRGLYGAARAAEAAGDQEKAASYFTKLVTLSKNADTDRPEIAQAKTFLAKK